MPNEGKSVNVTGLVGSELSDFSPEEGSDRHSRAPAGE
jgi:hypothetical protein